MRVLIADDESMARARVHRLLMAIGGVQIVAQCADGREVLASLEAHEVDLLFLDLQMPHLTGAEVAEFVPAGVQVVFLTAHADHAVQAFAQGATDYLLKPIDRQRLEQALERAKKRLDTPPTPSGKLALSSARGVVFVAVANITWCGIEGESVVVHAREPHYTELRLADLERRLPENFVRVHRRALVNLDHVLRLESVESGGYLAHLDDGAVVEVSRAAARSLRRTF